MPARCLFHYWKLNFDGSSLHCIHLLRMLLLQRLPNQKAAAIRMYPNRSVHARIRAIRWRRFTVATSYCNHISHKSISAAFTDTKNQWRTRRVREKQDRTRRMQKQKVNRKEKIENKKKRKRWKKRWRTRNALCYPYSFRLWKWWTNGASLNY